MMKLRKKTLLYIVSILGITVGVVTYMLDLDIYIANVNNIANAGLLCFVHFLIMLILSYKYNGKFNLYSIYLLAFFFFQCGQFALYGLRVDYNYFYIEHFDKSVLFKTIFFSCLCNMSAFLAVPFALSQHKNLFLDKLNNLSASSVYTIAKRIFLVISLVEIPYCLLRFIIVLNQGYQGVRSLEANMPSVLPFIDMLYVPITILCIIYSQYNHKLFSLVLITWGIINSLNGDRSSGIAAIMIFGLMYFNGIIGTRKINIKKRITLIIIMLLCAWLISYAYDFRNHVVNTGDSNKPSFIVNAVGELGFSFFPLMATMMICPSNVDFLYGKTIICSFLSSIMPLSFDFTGIFRQLYEISKEGIYWLNNYYDFSFGLGYSLNAESYANFGILGFIWIFLLNIMVSKILYQPDYTRQDNKYSQYVSFSMLFILFTMPRRSCYYLANFYIYQVIVIGLIMLYFGKFKSKNIR